MRSKLLLGFLVVAAFAFWPGNLIYSLTTRIYACDMPFGKASACNNLHGPVHTVELWSSLPGNQDPSMQDIVATHTLLTYSEDGLLIGREVRKNGVFESRSRYEKRDAGLTEVDEREWVENGQAHHAEDVISLDQQGDVISAKNRLDHGAFTINTKREFDGAGSEVLVSCSMEGKNCVSTRTESEHDAKGRLTFTKVIELPSGRVELHREYEYPAENRKRTLDFGGFCRDSNAPASLPTYLIETTYDGAGRVIEETTSAPGYSKPDKGIACFEDAESSPRPGHVVKQYDGQGHLVDETDSSTGEHRSYSYDQTGNLVSQRAIRNGGGEMQSEFSYEYDQFGNWTSMTSYDADSNGQRGNPWRIDYQKLTYYPQ